MAKSSKIASHGNSGRLAGGQLHGQLDYTNLVNQFSFIPSLSDLKFLRYGQKQQNSQPRQLQDSSWWLARLYYLSRLILSFILSKSDLKWLRYAQKQQFSQPRQLWDTSWQLVTSASDSEDDINYRYRQSDNIVDDKSSKLRQELPRTSLRPCW